MTTKIIELNSAERKYRMPVLEEMQEIDKSVKKILLITLNGDTMSVEVEVADKKVKPQAALKETTKTTKKAEAVKPVSAKATQKKTVAKKTTTRGKPLGKKDSE